MTALHPSHLRTEWEKLGDFPVKRLLALLEGTKMHLEDTEVKRKAKGRYVWLTFWEKWCG